MSRGCFSTCEMMYWRTFSPRRRTELIGGATLSTVAISIVNQRALDCQPSRAQPLSTSVRIRHARDECEDLVQRGLVSGRRVDVQRRRVDRDPIEVLVVTIA